MKEATTATRNGERGTGNGEQQQDSRNSCGDIIKKNVVGQKIFKEATTSSSKQSLTWQQLYQQHLMQQQLCRPEQQQWQQQQQQQH